MWFAVLGLGSNLGERASMLQGAVDALGETPGIRVLTVSPVYETTPLGELDQPNYLNSVVAVETTLPPTLLLERAQAIEDALGRVRTRRWDSRSIDVDILVFGEEVSDTPELALPHPGAYERACVLAPWNDIDPEATVPGHGRVADLLGQVGRDGVWRLDDLMLQQPT